MLLGIIVLASDAPLHSQGLQPYVPKELRGQIDAERMGHHDANRIRTRYFNYGMVGDFEGRPDLTVFHSVEVPKGSGLNYSDGTTPFVLARITQRNGRDAYIMETGYRERQGTSPVSGKTMRFEPRPGYFQANPGINTGRAPAISNDPRTWPDCWIDKQNDPDDPGWCDSWNGFFGKRPNADQESYFVIDDDYFDAWDYFPDDRDAGMAALDRRRGLGMRMEVRGFQWSNPQAANVIFFHYDVVNEATVDYDDNIIFGLYMDSGIGGSLVSCDGYGETDDDNAFYTTEFGQNLVYTWDNRGTGVSLTSNCAPTGYLGYAFLETPGNPFDGIDNDGDGITDERRDSGPGIKIVGQDAIRAYVEQHYDMEKFERFYGPLEERPAYMAGEWWTGDEDMDWVAELHDTGADGIWSRGNPGEPGYIPPDTGEGDGIPTAGEPNFDQTDINESDMIGLTGFKLNRISPGPGATSTEVDAIVFHTTGAQWPRRLYDMFSHPDEAVRFDVPLVENYNIAFLFASGPFKLHAGRRERFSLALAYGDDLRELQDNVAIVTQIYNANYQFAVPPPEPIVDAYVNKQGHVVLSWSNISEKAIDPVTNKNDFEGYRIYRSTDPTFLDPKVIRNSRGVEVFPIGAPMAIYDLKNGIRGFSKQLVQGVAYYLGDDTGITHTYVDTTVTLGQLYYYAVTAYDHGSDEFDFFPSENAVSVSRTARGGIVLPVNVVEVRPNYPVPGYIQAEIQPGSVQQISGDGRADVSVRIINHDLVPDGHDFQIDFRAASDSVKAESYDLTDLTTGQVLFSGGVDFDAEGTGPVGAGLKPVIYTPPSVSLDDERSGLMPGSRSNIAIQARYAEVLPANMRRPGYPDNLIITFSDQPLDTTLAAIGAPARPVNFRVTSELTGEKLRIRFRDVDGDGTLSAPDEFIEVVTYTPDRPTTPRPTWNISLDMERINGTIIPPTAGDVYRIEFAKPVGVQDAFVFSTRGSRVDEVQAVQDYEEEKPYVVPNPYVASASFEPERFAVHGRGERRLEFRAIPANSTIRIYTLRGELVETLHHDGSVTGMVPWDLRSKDNLEVAPGLYIFHVDSGPLGEHIGKFAIIK